MQKLDLDHYIRKDIEVFEQRVVHAVRHFFVNL